MALCVSMCRTLSTARLWLNGKCWAKSTNELYNTIIKYFHCILFEFPLVCRCIFNLKVSFVSNARRRHFHLFFFFSFAFMLYNNFDESKQLNGFSWNCTNTEFHGVHSAHCARTISYELFKKYAECITRRHIVCVQQIVELPFIECVQKRNEELKSI